MIELVDKKGFKKRVIVWFPEDGYTVEQKCDVCCYIGVRTLHDISNTHTKFVSLVSDLQRSSDEIMADFSKVNKYDIRRSKNDSFSIKYLTSDQLIDNADFYSIYKNVYEGMYQAKGLNGIAPINAMKFYAKNHALIISMVYIDEEPVVIHSYIVDGKNTRLWMSCSTFRESENKQFRALMGRANKRLHFEDMMYFSNQGYLLYDWGGCASIVQPNGIDQFKISFGGKPIEYFDETVIMSLKYRVIFALKSILKRFKQHMK